MPGADRRGADQTDRNLGSIALLQQPALMESPPTKSIRDLPAIETTRLVEGLLPSPSHSLTGASGVGARQEEGTEGLHRSTGHRTRPAIVLLLTVMMAAILGGFLIHAYQSELLRACEWMQEHAPASLVAYCAVSMVWILVCLPSTITEVTAGFIYGFPVSLLAMLVSKVLACTLAFLLGRALAGDALKRGLRQSSSVRLRAMVHAMEKHPWRVTLLLRVAYLPVAVKNYGMAMLPCPLRVYVVATVAVALIYTPLLTHVGASSRCLLDTARGGDGNRSAASEAILLSVSVGGAVALVCTLRRLSTRYLNQAEQEAEEDDQEEQLSEEQGLVSYSGKCAPSSILMGPPEASWVDEDVGKERGLVGPEASASLLLKDEERGGRAEQKARSRAASKEEQASGVYHHQAGGLVLRQAKDGSSNSSLLEAMISKGEAAEGEKAFAVAVGSEVV